jgi:hypothetical protein
MPFEAGISGNPKGRPKGIKDRRHLFTLELFEETNGEVKCLFKSFLKSGLEGDFHKGAKVLDFMLVKPSNNDNTNTEEENEKSNVKLSSEDLKALAAILEGKKSE